MSTYYDPERRVAPKVLQGKLRQHIRKSLAFTKRRPETAGSPADQMRFLLDRVKSGVFDYDSSDFRQRHSSRLVKRAVVNHLMHALNYCESHPELTDSTAQLERTLAAVESEAFKPRMMNNPQQPRTGTNSSQVTSVPQKRMNSSQEAVQGRTEAYEGLIDTEEYEPW